MTTLLSPNDLRIPDACARTLQIVDRPTMPGYSKVPPIFRKAISWAYICEGCARQLHPLLGDAVVGGLEALRELLSCQPCFAELQIEFKRHPETKDKAAPHPKALSRAAYCESCSVMIIQEAGRLHGAQEAQSLGR